MLDTINKLIGESCQEFQQMADDIHRHPEMAYNEYYAADRLCGWLEAHGFTVERGIAGIPTAFKAVWQQGEGGISIGLLPEYDANQNGHSCGHHLQGPVIFSAVDALMKAGISEPFKLVIYGTPAEEILTGKYRMLEAGCFKDIDVALQVHAFDTTGPHNGLAGFDLDTKFIADCNDSSSKLPGPAASGDAFSLAVQGIAGLRKRLPSGTRFFECILKNGGEPDENGIDCCEAVFSFRCLNYTEAAAAESRMREILQGAALIAGTRIEIEKTLIAKDVIHVPGLTGLWMQKARELSAPRIVDDAKQNSSTTDFGAVSQEVPGSIIWFATTPKGTALHCDLFKELGCSEESHNAMVTGSEILAQTCYDLITVPGLIEEIKESHRRIMAERMV